MANFLVVVATLAIPGILPASALFGSRYGVAASPATTAIFLGTAGSLAPLLHLAPKNSYFPAAIAANGLAMLSLARRYRTKSAGTPFRLFRWGELVVFGISLSPLLGLRQGPYAWDFRSIWLLHARLLDLPFGSYRAAFRSKTLAFSHMDYPILGPSAMKWVWRFGSGDRAEMAQAAVAVTCISALATGALLVHGWVATRRQSSYAGVVAASGFVIGTFLMSRDSLYNGYVDGLWSLLLVVGILFVLTTGQGFSLASLVWFVGASLTKNEGAVAAVLALIVLMVVLRVRAVKRLAFVISPFAVWSLFARSSGAPSDYGPDSFSRLLRDIPTFLHRFRSALWSMGPQLSGSILLLALAGYFVGGSTKRLLDPASPTRKPFVAVLSIAVLVSFFVAFSYGISNYEIEWHLRTSVDRTTIFPRLLLLVCVVFAGAEWVFSKRSVLAVGAVFAVPLGMAFRAGMSQFVSLVEPTRGSAAQFACVEKELDRQLAPSDVAFIAVKDDLWKQRIIEFSAGRVAFADAPNAATRTVDAVGDPSARCGLRLVVAKVSAVP